VQKKLTIVESFCVGKEHVVVNAKLIKDFVNNNIGCSVDFFGEKNHIKYIKELLSPEEICIINFIIIKVKRNVNVITSLLFQFKIIFNVFLLSRSKRFLFCSLLADSQIVIKLFSIFIKSDIYAIPHASLCDLDNKYDFKRPKEWLRYIFSFKFWFINFKTNKLCYVILGEHIEKKLHEKKLLKGVKYKVIEVPYLYNEEIKLKENMITSLSLDVGFKVGFLGQGTVEKGIDKFVELSQINFLNSKNEFYLAGGLHSSCKPLPCSIHTLEESNGLIDFNKMMTLACKMDFFVLFLNSKEYELRASATFFDIVNINKPMIILKNSFKYSESLGVPPESVGIVCDNLSDIINRLKNISLEEYSSYKRELFRLKIHLMKANSTRFLN
jgi:hypothetical protein